MRNPYFASLKTGIYESRGVPVRNLLAATGGNTGNLLFTAAAHKVVRYDRFDCGYVFDPAEVRERHDGIIVSAANWLNSTKDLGELARRIEATGLSCVILGLGAQSISAKTKPSLLPGTFRLVQVAAERSHSISVRGEYTASVLEDYGIKNVTVTGCPSLLWAMSPIHIAKPDKAVKDIAISSTRGHFDERIFGNNRRSKLSRLLTRLAKSRDVDYVAQTELPDMYFALNQLQDEEIHRKSVQFLSRLYNERNEDRLQDYLRRRAKVFFNVEDWVAFLKGRDLTVGTRLHGTIASLLAGTPAMLIVHDMRTREMARHLGIPYMNMTEVLRRGDLDFQSIYESLDFSKFNRRQRRYYREFVTFLDKNGIAHKLGGAERFKPKAVGLFSRLRKWRRALQAI